MIIRSEPAGESTACHHQTPWVAFYYRTYIKQCTAVNRVYSVTVGLPVLQHYKVTLLQYRCITGRASVTDFTASFPSPGEAHGIAQMSTLPPTIPLASLPYLTLPSYVLTIPFISLNHHKHLYHQQGWNHWSGHWTGRLGNRPGCSSPFHTFPLQWIAMESFRGCLTSQALHVATIFASVRFCAACRSVL